MGSHAAAKVDEGAARRQGGRHIRSICSCIDPMARTDDIIDQRNVLIPFGVNFQGAANG